MSVESNELPELLDRNEIGLLLRMSRRSTYKLALPPSIMLRGKGCKKLWLKKDIMNWLETKKQGK